MAVNYMFIDARSEYLPLAVAVRIEVFVQEQAVPIDQELDALDGTAIHEIAVENGTVVGTLRVLPGATDGKIGRVAVKRVWRNKGIGREMMQRAIRYLARHGCRSVAVDAQLAVTGFYESLGFYQMGDVFLDAGIPHVRMLKTI